MRIKATKADVNEVDMTPMIDIVFQLIAFFMVITNFENAKADERVKLPKDELAKPVEIKREKELLLQIGFIRNKEGDKLSDPLVFYAGEEIPVLEISPALTRENASYKSIGVDPKDVTVVIRADREVPTGLVQEMIKFSQEAGFEKFAMKATQKQDGN
ncbi:MAG: biopolymer transporter ExbD [Planctomycetaceae bacterium]|nr:biopolymer transporter ExbD [Planctomycetaceae bacterium]